MSMNSSCALALNVWIKIYTHQSQRTACIMRSDLIDTDNQSKEADFQRLLRWTHLKSYPVKTRATV